MRAYVYITGVIFGVVTLAHALRLIMGWPIELAGLAIPVWMSWLGILVAGALCAWAFRLVGRADE